jgi:hypothetical protein
MLTKRTVLTAAMALLAIVVFFAWTAWNDGHFGWARIIGLAATVLLLAVIWIWAHEPTTNTTPTLKSLDGCSVKRLSWMKHEQPFALLDTARLLFGAVGMLGVLVEMPRLANSQTPAYDVAAQVRTQGYRCDQPTTARRDVRLSKPDSAVWVLQCRNASYRVRLVPDMAAHITKLRRH